MRNKNLVRNLLDGNSITQREASYLGDTSKASKEFPFSYVIRSDRFIDGGAYGNVYPIEGYNHLVVKVEKSPEDEYHSIPRGGRTQKYLHEKGFNVPKPIGMFNIYDIKEKKFSKGLVMERINGQTLYQIDSNRNPSEKLKQKIERERERIIKKAKKRFNVFDSNYKNVMYDFQTQKTYLIDLDAWEKKNLMERFWDLFKKNEK